MKHDKGGAEIVLTRVSRLGREESGFTLIELLVVVAIIALLTAFAVPKLFDAINKSKDARGQGDMETIPGSFDRYYFDNNTFPTGTSAEVKAELVPDYLKVSTKFVNGYNKGYIYVTDDEGAFYLVIDPKNEAEGAAITVACGATTNAPAIAVGTDLTAVVSSNLTLDLVNNGCTVTNADDEELPFVTN